MKRLALLGIAVLALMPAVASAGRTSFFLGFGVGVPYAGVGVGFGYPYGGVSVGVGAGYWAPYHYYHPYVYNDYYYAPAPVVVTSAPAVTYAAPAYYAPAPYYYAPVGYYYHPHPVAYYYGGGYYYRH